MKIVWQIPLVLSIRRHHRALQARLSQLNPDTYHASCHRIQSSTIVRLLTVVKLMIRVSTMLLAMLVSLVAMVLIIDMSDVVNGEMNLKFLYFNIEKEIVVQI